MTSPDSFLHSLHEADRAALAERWSVRLYQRKEMIIAHDEETRDVFFVLEGSARATVYSEAGRAVAYRDIEPGGIFGEIAAIDGRPRSATVIGLEPVLVAKLPQAAFREIVRSHPDLTWALLTHLALQTRRMTERIYEFSTLVMRKRLVRELLRLAEADGSGAAHASIRPAPTHSDLAARISTHREAVSREMSTLAKQKLIEKRKGLLVLLDLARLEALCHEEE
jgi:CRP/FNR family cyclic AMP-dependent transcriptional regulator